MDKNLAHKLTTDLFDEAVAALPPLPKTIQYDDDYDEKVRSVKVADTEEVLTIYISGKASTLSFLKFSPRVRQLVRMYLLLMLQEQATITIQGKHQQLSELPAEVLEQAASAKPMQLRQAWPVYVANYSTGAVNGLRGLLSFLCAVGFMAWSTSYSQFVAKALFISKQAPYPTVRNGDAFLTIGEEARIVRWFDATVMKADNLTLNEVEIACLLVSSYQFGMRPKQLGIIRMRDCKLHISNEDGSTIVHLTFRMLKQKDPTLARFPLVRKIKREWTPLYARLLKLKSTAPNDAFLFGFKSRAELSMALSNKLEEILPDSERRVAYDLRHSMAQRLVDAGSSHEDLAAALGQSNLATGLVYFRQSANQAEIVNKALGLSNVYRTIADIAQRRSIGIEELAKLKGEQQIAGAPHGFSVAGIGGCQAGQPTCPFNPVSACYGCDRFMPVRNTTMHRQVLAEYRGVVNQFRAMGRDDLSSPAYLQLRRTISDIQDTICDLEGGGSR